MRLDEWPQLPVGGLRRDQRDLPAVQDVSAIGLAAQDVKVVTPHIAVVQLDATVDHDGHAGNSQLQPRAPALLGVEPIVGRGLSQERLGETLRCVRSQTLRPYSGSMGRQYGSTVSVKTIAIAAMAV